MNPYLCRAEVEIDAETAEDAALKAMEHLRMSRGMYFEVYEGHPNVDGYRQICTMVYARMAVKPQKISRKRSAKRSGNKQNNKARKGKV